MTISTIKNHTQTKTKNQYYKSVSFSKKLYDWRKAAGLTQKELAERLDVNVSYISNLERDFSPTAKGGSPQPSREFVDALAKVLRVPLHEVRLAAGYSPFSTSPSEEDALLMSLFLKHSKLTPKEKAEFRRVLEMVDRELDRIEEEENRTSAN
jgi:transcriptional regulator with XRE-family HTH domain